jgi:group I intron endonuclease
MPYKNTNINPDTTFIYVLESGDDIRYVGKADHPRRRLCQHKATSGFKNPHLHRWMKKVGDVRLTVIDEVSKKNWVFWEKWYIQLFKSWGFRLVNLTEGGDGFDGYKPTPEVFEKIRKNRAYLRGDKNPMYGKNGEAHPAFGRMHTEEVKKRMSERQRGAANHRFGTKLTDSQKIEIRKNSGTPIEIMGINYYSIREACEKLNICRSVARRMAKSKGVSHEEAIRFCLSKKTNVVKATTIRRPKTNKTKARAMSGGKIINMLIKRGEEYVKYRNLCGNYDNK